MKRIEININDIKYIKVGTIIEYNVWDNDDFVTWTFKAIRVKDGFIYLGGGCDFGAGIGNKMSVEEVAKDINNNDFPKFTIMTLISLENLVGGDE